MKQKNSTPFGMLFLLFGADEQIRTVYLLITNEVLYRLSYISARNEHYSEASRSLQVLFPLRAREFQIALRYSSTRMTLSTVFTQSSALICSSALRTANSLAACVINVMRALTPSGSPS